MKSFCIKTNNVKIQDYLLNNLANIDLEDIYFIKKEFKIYQNIIVHYKGQYYDDFISALSSIITNCILIYYEPILIVNSIKLNYFYFDDYEKNLIEKICYSHIIQDEDDTLKYRNIEIYLEVVRYLNENKSMILDGFVNFRLRNYLATIDDIVDFSVNKYVIEKEYNEFIDLLKTYVNSKESSIDIVHIIYNNGESILLDKNKNIIKKDESIFNSKYLSDITFSSNDYTLNSLLSLLPKRIEIHIIGNEDEFISTLKLVFSTRVFICTDCSLCNLYRVSNKTLQ